MKRLGSILLGLCLLWACRSGEGTKFFRDSRDGELYLLVQIGKQLWMADNMRYKVPGSVLNPASPSEKYGRLYTWNQAMQVCPEGWRLPSDGDWKTLELYLGMSRIEVDREDYSFRGSIGYKMKSRDGWDFVNDTWGNYVPGNGTNSSGFNALPAGYYVAGDFFGLGEYGQFWTSTEKLGEWIWYRDLYHNGSVVSRSIRNKFESCSCRCLKD